MNYKGHDPYKWATYYRGRAIDAPWGERARVELYGRRVSRKRSIVTEITRLHWHQDGGTFWGVYLGDGEEE